MRRRVVVPLDSPWVAAAGRAIERAFGTPPVFMREGGSIPVVATFRELLGVDTLLLGWGLDDDNTHSPNEKFSPGRLPSRHRGQRLSVGRVGSGPKTGQCRETGECQKNRLKLYLPSISNSPLRRSMLDRRFVLENADLVRRNCADRGSKADVDRFVALEVAPQGEASRARNAQSPGQRGEQIDRQGQGCRPSATPARKKAGGFAKRPPPCRPKSTRSPPKPTRFCKTIPNLSHPDAPRGADDQANLEIRRGKHAPPKFDFQPLDHVRAGRAAWI